MEKKKIEIDGENIEVKCEVYYMSFSAHADQKGLLQLINNIAPKNFLLKTKIIIGIVRNNKTTSVL